MDVLIAVVTTSTLSGPHIRVPSRAVRRLRDTKWLGSAGYAACPPPGDVYLNASLWYLQKLRVLPHLRRAEIRVTIPQILFLTRFSP